MIGFEVLIDLWSVPAAATQHMIIGTSSQATMCGIRHMVPADCCRGEDGARLDWTG